MSNPPPKIVLITGVTRGLGRAMADELVAWLKVQDFMHEPAKEKMEARKTLPKSDH